MGRTTIRAQQSAGFSLIEVMLAGGLVAFMAVAMLPAIFSVGSNSVAAGFKSQCTAMVRAKLQEYLNGVADNSLMGANFTPSGFEYTKKRFQLKGNTCSLTPTRGSPGFREAVYSNAYDIGQETAADGSPALSRELLGFQLWTMIRLYNPRNLTNGHPSRECPSNYNEYQFFRLGDALEVTVTGMIRTRGTVGSGARGNRPFGKLDDVDDFTPHASLTCSASEIIYPPRLPFRYYLAPDGKILNLQAKLALTNTQLGASAEATEAHFRRVWAGSGQTSISNIRGFAVAPDNKYVWVMRPGELSRYGPCFETRTAVTVDGVTQQVGGDVTVNFTSNPANDKNFKGVPDCPSKPTMNDLSTGPTGPDGLTWATDPNIEVITVDFKDLSTPTDDVVYGFPNTGSGQGATGILRATLGATTATWATTSVAGFSIPANRPRIRGFFIAQTFPSVTAPNLFFFDNTCYTGTQGANQGSYRYCTSIFSSADTNMEQEMREVPIQLEAISY